MENGKYTLSSFSDGIYAGSCGKQEAVDQHLTRQAGQGAELLIYDPQKELPVNMPSEE